MLFKKIKLFVPLALGSIFGVLGAILKIQHLPLSDTTLLVSFVISAYGAMTIFKAEKIKKQELLSEVKKIVEVNRNESLRKDFSPELDIFDTIKKNKNI